MTTQIHLVQSEAGERISGGYLYNHNICTATNAAHLHSCRSDDLTATLQTLQLRHHDLLLADSIFLNEIELQAFLRAKQDTGCTLGLMLHAFPSFVTRAQDRDQFESALPLTLTTREIELCSKLDLCVAPGPYAVSRLKEAQLDLECVVCRPGYDSQTPRAPKPDVSKPSEHIATLLQSPGTAAKLRRGRAEEAPSWQTWQQAAAHFVSNVKAATI